MDAKTMQRMDLQTRTVDEAEKAQLATIPSGAGLCPIAAFMRLFLSGSLGHDLRDVFLAWLVTVPAAITDAILDDRERVQVQVARDNVSHKQDLDQSVTDDVDRQIANFVMNTQVELKERAVAAFTNRVEILEVCLCFSPHSAKTKTMKMPARESEK